MPIRIDGFNRVTNRLRRIASQTPVVTDKVVGNWARNTQAALKSEPYPAKRPGQRYVRTGRFANSWKAERIKPGSWNITNTARHRGRVYAVYVAGDALGQGQAYMHKGRWWLARDVIQREAPKLTAELTTELNKLMEQD